MPRNTPPRNVLDPHMGHPIYLNLMIHCADFILILTPHFVRKQILPERLANGNLSCLHIPLR